MITNRSKLAIHGGTPVRKQLLPYGKQWIDEKDITSVVEILSGDFLTTGPAVAQFETALARCAGTSDAVAFSSGTAALHAAMFALNISPGDEVIVPAMTFAATANCVCYQRATPVIADVDSHSLLLTADTVEPHINDRTRAIIAVDYAGQPCDYDSLRQLANRYKISLIADACHAIGATYNGRPVGSLADISTFSFHPVKHITTGEGGGLTTDNPELASRARLFRNHGITTDHRQREEAGSWFYEMVELGYNYRLPDLACALGRSQLAKLPQWIARRRDIARKYDLAFADLPGVSPLKKLPDREHAYHLYVIRLQTNGLIGKRREIYSALRAEGIAANVHYIPVHLHPYYRQQHGTRIGQCPAAEAAYEEILSLPIFPRMTDQDVDDVIAAVQKVTTALLRD